MGEWSGEFVASRVHAHPRLMVPNGLSFLSYFGHFSAQSFRLVLVDPTDEYLESVSTLLPHSPNENGSLPSPVVTPPSFLISRPSTYCSLSLIIIRFIRFLSVGHRSSHGEKITAESLLARAGSYGYKGAHRDKDSTRDGKRYIDKTTKDPNAALDRYVL